MFREFWPMCSHCRHTGSLSTLLSAHVEGRNVVNRVEEKRDSVESMETVWKVWKQGENSGKQRGTPAVQKEHSVPQCVHIVFT